ncbi:MAG: NUDIX hydrolase [Myxococcota bacterium]
MSRRLPAPPKTQVRVVEDYTARSRCDEGFIRLRRRMLRTQAPDGTCSEPFPYDEVVRRALDAVVIAAHFEDEQGVERVYLRTALRPPVALRSRDQSPIPEPVDLGHLWELPAGLVEANERSEDGLRRCAARELAEEIGFHLPPEAMLPLGPPTFPAPAIIGERHFYFHCVVAPHQRGRPAGDGSALELQATVTAVSVDDALQLTRLGEIEDSKTEIGLRRLREMLP